MLNDLPQVWLIIWTNGRVSSSRHRVVRAIELVVVKLWVLRAFWILKRNSGSGRVFGKWDDIVLVNLFFLGIMWG